MLEACSVESLETPGQEDAAELGLPNGDGQEARLDSQSGQVAWFKSLRYSFKQARRQVPFRILRTYHGYG